MPTETTTETRLLGNYIGGRWVPAGAESSALDVTNPATGEVLARVPLSGAADVDAAVAAAREAFPGWRSRSTIERARWLFRFRQVMEAHQDELARSVTREMGKTLPDARAEVGRAIEMIEAASPSRRRCRAGSSRTSRRRSTPRRSASRSASARRSCRSTSRRWCRSGSCRSRSRAATRSSSSRPSRCR